MSAAPPSDSDTIAVARTMERINQAWLSGRPDDMAPYLDANIAMALPGFSATVQGRDVVVGSFREFSRTAVLGQCTIDSPAVTVVGPIAVATFPWVVVYERDGKRWRSTGRDVWVFGREGTEWRAAWRAMLDIAEEPAP